MLIKLKRAMNSYGTRLRVKTGGVYGRQQPYHDPFASMVKPEAKIIVQMRVIRADGTIEDLPPGEGVITRD